MMMGISSYMGATLTAIGSRWPFLDPEALEQIHADAPFDEIPHHCSRFLFMNVLALH